MEATTIQSLFDAKTGYSEEKHVNQQRKIMIDLKSAAIFLGDVN